MKPFYHKVNNRWSKQRILGRYQMMLIAMLMMVMMMSIVVILSKDEKLEGISADVMTI